MFELVYIVEHEELAHPSVKTVISSHDTQKECATALKAYHDDNWRPGWTYGYQIDARSSLLNPTYTWLQVKVINPETNGFEQLKCVEVQAHLTS